VGVSINGTTDNAEIERRIARQDADKYERMMREKPGEYWGSPQQIQERIAKRLSGRWRRRWIKGLREERARLSQPIPARRQLPYQDRRQRRVLAPFDQAGPF
jgi:hypothetical protein